MSFVHNLHHTGGACLLGSTGGTNSFGTAVPFGWFVPKTGHRSNIGSNIVVTVIIAFASRQRACTRSMSMMRFNVDHTFKTEKWPEIKKKTQGKKDNIRYKISTLFFLLISRMYLQKATPTNSS